MKLTDKTNKSFRLYLMENIPTSKLGIWSSHELWFDDLIDSCKYGLLVDFFDSVGVSISDLPFYDNLGYIRGYEPTIYFDSKEKPITLYQDNDVFETRPQARTAAIHKANENYNNLK